MASGILRRRRLGLDRQRGGARRAGRAGPRALAARSRARAKGEDAGLGARPRRHLALAVAEGAAGRRCAKAEAGAPTSTSTARTSSAAQANVIAAPRSRRAGDRLAPRASAPPTTRRSPRSRTRAASAWLASGRPLESPPRCCQHSALTAARHVPEFEIIDYAKSTKPDAPSGTARELAAAARRDRAQSNPGRARLDKIIGPKETPRRQHRRRPRPFGAPAELRDRGRGDLRQGRRAPDPAPRRRHQRRALCRAAPCSPRAACAEIKGLVRGLDTLLFGAHADVTPPTEEDQAMTWTGGCLCGAVRYRSEADPVRDGDLSLRDLPACLRRADAVLRAFSGRRLHVGSPVGRRAIAHRPMRSAGSAGTAAARSPCMSR